MTATIKMTESARGYIEKMIQKENGIGFRLTIRKTGCSGYSYAPSIVTEENLHDTVVKDTGKPTVFLDTTWLHLLDNLEIDYIEEDKTGLKQKKLLFTNPKESSRCGCGESFHVE